MILVLLYNCLCTSSLSSSQMLVNVLVFLFLKVSVITENGKKLVEIGDKFQEVVVLMMLLMDRLYVLMHFFSFGCVNPFYSIFEIQVVLVSEKTMYRLPFQDLLEGKLFTFLIFNFLT